MFGLNWLDIVVICVLLFGIFDGMSKGFILSFFNIAGIFISLYLSRFFMGMFADFLVKNTSIYTSLENSFNKRMSGIDSLSASLLKLFDVKGIRLSESITMVVIDIACFIIIFFTVSILINIFKNILKDRVKKSSLKQVDKLLGGAIGFTVSAILIFIFFAIIIPLTTVLPKDNSFVSAIEASKFAKYFYFYNFVLPWLQKVNYTKGIFAILYNIKYII